MSNIKDIINRYALVPNRYTIKRNATIINTDDGHFVFKKKKTDSKTDELFKYLKSRNFSHLPKLVDNDDRYDIYEYIEEINVPREQKALDLMYIISILHYKTTYYKDIDEDEIKAIYEDTIKQIDYTYNYYTDIITLIESKIYMSPSEYLIARNISKVFQSLMFSRREIEHWYELVKAKQKKRVVTLHNNLDIDHLIENKDLYLLSWEKTKQDNPIYDLLDFYKRYALEFDFSELLKTYEDKFKLLKEEKVLMFVLMSIPDKMVFGKTEIENCRRARKILDYIFKTEILLTPYYTVEDIKK
ncbi:MAG TPA: hypothetical protein GXZ95_04295 [Mollicutes bacterium]|nr:hypothetical protein [Mollicutes bacterium]